MKKVVAIILTFSLLCSFAAVIADTDFSFIPKRTITREEAVAFADDISQLVRKDYDASNRLIVSSSKKITDNNAAEIIEGVNNLYILQYENEEEFVNAQEYLGSLPYVKYVEKDSECEVSLCSEEVSYPYEVQNVITTETNMDDAMRLVYNAGYEFKEIHVGIVDSGISINSFTKDRFAGGCTFYDDFAADGTQDVVGHGTLVSSCIIFNTMDNVKLHSYQICGPVGCCYSTAMIISAYYLAAADGCKIINCSFSGVGDNKSEHEAVRYCCEQGIIFVASAGNANGDGVLYPACFDEVISVGASNYYRKIGDISKRGKYVNIYAPGTLVPCMDMSERIIARSGTSLSSPIYASVVTLLLTVNPDITKSEIQKLTQETGECLFENGRNDPGEVIVDAYAAVKKLINSELQQVNLDYEIERSPDKQEAYITFHCDEDAQVSYYAEDNFILPTNAKYGVQALTKYAKNGDTITVNKNSSIKAIAYADGKEKSEYQIFSVPVHNNDCGFIFESADENNIYNTVSYSSSDDAVIEVPAYIDGNAVQKIGNNCFMGKKNAEIIVLPDSVREIGSFAFANCPNLKVVIAPGVEKCDYMAFYNCRSLKSVNMPNVTVAETGVFKNCCSLKNLQIGELTKICNQAFYCCEELSFLNVSKSVDKFCDSTFYKCSALTVNAPEESFMAAYAAQKSIPIGNIPDEKCEHSNLTVIRNLDETCVGYGYRVSECDNCKALFTYFNCAPGHKYIAEVINPTCISVGYTEYTCSVCADTYRDSYKEMIPHDWQSTVTKEPTWNDEGEEYYRCLYCGEDYTEILPSLSSYHTITGKTVLAQSASGEHAGNYVLAGVDVFAADSLKATTDENGEFEFKLLNGTHTLIFKYDCGIEARVQCIVNDNDVSLGVISIAGMDFIDDEYINAKDYAVMLKQLSKGDGDYKAEFDLNNDGLINETDVKMLSDFILSVSQV